METPQILPQRGGNGASFGLTSPYRVNMVRAVLDGLPHCGAIRVKPLSLEDLTSPAGIFFAAVGAGSLVG
jgi:hypothetical protein